MLLSNTCSRHSNVIAMQKNNDRCFKKDNKFQFYKTAGQEFPNKKMIP